MLGGGPYHPATPKKLKQMTLFGSSASPSSPAPLCLPSPEARLVRVPPTMHQLVEMAGSTPQAVEMAASAIQEIQAAEKAPVFWKPGELSVKSDQQEVRRPGAAANRTPRPRGHTQRQSPCLPTP